MNASGRRTTRGIRGIGLCLAVAAASIGPAPARGQAPTAEPAAAAEQRDLPRNLRVAVAPIASAVEWRGDRPVGVMIDVWNDLAGRLGTTTS